MRTSPNGRSHAVIIGGGVGGLTAAIALHRRGWTSTVFERAPALAPVGAGISVAPNAQRALDRIGLGDDVRALGGWHREAGLRVPSGRWLSRTDNRAFAERFGGPLVLLHRAELVDLLAGALPEGVVRLDTRATVMDPGAVHRPAVVCAGGEELSADLVVAADGIRSSARRILFPEHPGLRYSGFSTWRMVVSESPVRDFAPHETWGCGALWGSQPLPDGRVYAYGAAATPAEGHAQNDEQAELRRRFGSWHHPIPDLIQAVDAPEVLRSDVHELAEQLPAQHRGRVALLGDAAHPMAPNLGQGGNQAIEDAIVLAQHADPRTAPAVALAAYSADRVPRTTDVVRRSARVGRMNTLRSPAACRVRDIGLSAVNRLAPGLALRALDGVADWRPPGPQTTSRAAD